MRRRTRDFGVRIALAASPRQILSSLRGLLYGIGPTDGRTYVAVFGLLAAASLAACYLPARQATRIDPLQALRQE